MAYMDYLAFEGSTLPLPDSYRYSLSDVEADSSGETEAGTTQRDVVRSGIATVSVSFTVTGKWLKLLSAYAKKDQFMADFYDTERLRMRNAAVFISGFSSSLKKDTPFGGLWEVSFELNEI